MNKGGRFHLVCLSASNVRCARDQGTSLRVGWIVQEIVAEKVAGGASADAFAWADQHLKACMERGHCAANPTFDAPMARP